MAGTLQEKSSPKQVAAFIVVAVMVVAATAVFTITYYKATVKSDPGAITMNSSLNATIIERNHAVMLTMSERNSLDYTNQLNFSENWAVGNLSAGPCGFYLPFGVGVFQGRYTGANVSSATPMQIDSPGTLFCPLIGMSMSLGPHESLTKSENLSGYWTQPNGSLSQGVFNPFPPGPYTVVVGDGWGHIQFMYFEVRGVYLEGFSLCSSDCVYPSPYLSGIIIIDSSAPVESYQLLVNGTSQGTTPWSGINLTSFALWYKGGFGTPRVVKGETYDLTFTFVFQDGSTSSASTSVKAY